MEQLLIHRQMIAIMREVGAIPKDSKNQAQNFLFRSIDSVMAALHDIMARNGVVLLPRVKESRIEERVTKSGTSMTQHFLTMEYTFIAEDGSSVTTSAIGEGSDSGDKSSSKAMSIALKYCLLQTFLIPTSDEKDPDAQSPDLSGGRRKKATGSVLTPEQQDVLDRKLAEKKQSALSAEQIQMLQAFGDMKKKIGDKEYYFILGNNGYEKSNQITKVEEARRIYRQMAERSKEIDMEKDGGLPPL